MRVIAGLYRSRKLIPIVDEHTRPTTDANKEMIFNSLGQFFNGGMALDLFSGTGSLGIEAISRGMKYAYLNELNNTTFEVLKKNVHNIGIENVTITNLDFKAFLKMYSNQKFDLVLLDPPYAIADEIPGIIRYMLRKDMIKKDAQLVLETPKEMEYTPVNFEIIKNKTGAASRFVILRYTGDKK